MAASDVEKAIIMLQGIASRDADLALRHVDSRRYTEHNPRVGDGVPGLREVVRQDPEENRQITVIRAFQDGAFVFTQEQGNMLGRSDFFDVFRFEEGFIIEHWGFAAAGGPPNKSGHTQVDGPTQSKDEDKTESNKSIVRDYYQAVHLGGRHDDIAQYTTGECMVRHEPGVADGVTEFKNDLAVLVQDRTIDEIGLLLGQGDFVFLAARGTAHGDPCAYIDLYRVEDDKLVEHWGFPEEMPPETEWKNPNGMV